MAALVKAGGDGAEVLEPVDTALHDVAAPVGLSVERWRPAASAAPGQAVSLAVAALRADAADATALQQSAARRQPVGSVHAQHRGALAGAPPLQTRHTDGVEHRAQVAHIRALPGRDEQAQRTGSSVAAQVDLGGAHAARAPQPLVAQRPPFSACGSWCRAPQALRCALTCVASSAAPFQSISPRASASACRACSRRSQVPSRRQRTKRS